MEDNNKQQGSFVVNIYSPGNEIIQTQNNTYYGPVYQGVREAGMHNYTDEQIKTALLACVGEDKVIDSKWKWAGAYWYMRWCCKYPVDPKDFCKKIEELGLGLPAKYRCDYRNIREFTTLSFMTQDASIIDKVKPSKADEKVFSICREVALKLAEELGKAYLKKA